MKKFAVVLISFGPPEGRVHTHIVSEHSTITAARGARNDIAEKESEHFMTHSDIDGFASIVPMAGETLAIQMHDRDGNVELTRFATIARRQK